MASNLPFRFECLEQKCLLTGFPQLVADTAANADTDLAGSFSDRDRLYFYASEKHSGREIWETDGTKEGTRRVGDFAPGPDASLAELWGQLGETRIFFANRGLWAASTEGNDPTLLVDNVHKNFSGNSERLFFGKEFELWVTDGTVNGTFAIHTQTRVLEVVSSKNGTALFRTDAGEYWHTDGTVAGTILLLPSFTARRFVSGSSPAITMRATDGGWLFRGTNYNENGQPDGEGLWFSDGSRDNTKAFLPLIADIEFLAKQSGQMVFTGKRDHWISDGTQAGTRRVFPTFQRDFAGANSAGFFFTTTWEEKTELWQFKDSETEPSKIGDIADHAADVRPISTLPDNRFVFRVYAPNQESYVWVSDGTEEGTHPLPIPTTNVSRFTITHGHDGNRFAIEVVDRDVISVWISDGTPDSTWLATSTSLQDTPPKFGERRFQPQVGIHNTLFFTETLEQGGQLLWEVPAATQELVERQSAQEFDKFKVIDEQLNYVAIRGKQESKETPFALWQLSVSAGDGKAAPRIIRELETATKDANITQLVPFQDRVFFVKDGSELWQTDGTEAGTGQVQPANATFPSVRQLTAGETHVYFLDVDPFGIGSIWRTDGTPNGTAITESDVRHPVELQSLNGRMFLRTLAPRVLWQIDEATGNRLTNATTSETAVRINDDEIFVPDERVVVNLETSEYHKLNLPNSPSDVFNFKDRIVFNMENEVWSSDGTQTGTFRITNGDGKHFVYAANQLYFAVDDAVYVSDGTAKGTTRVSVLLPPENSITSMHHVQETLFIFYESPLTQTEHLIAVRDSGTTDLFSSDDPSYNHIVANNQLFFSVADQLWKTDGSEIGTQQIQGVFPVEERTALSKEANDIVMGNNELFFLAQDGLHGNELWKLSFTEPRIPGDVSRDGIVNFTDFLMLSENFGKSVFPNESGDLDGDGKVNFTDFLLLSAAFGME